MATRIERKKKGQNQIQNGKENIKKENNNNKFEKKREGKIEHRHTDTQSNHKLQITRGVGMRERVVTVVCCKEYLKKKKKKALRNGK